MDKFKITYKDDWVLVHLGDKELEVFNYSEDNILLDCDLECISDLNIANVPENISIRIHDSTGFDKYFFLPLNFQS